MFFFVMATLILVIQIVLTVVIMVIAAYAQIMMCVILLVMIQCAAILTLVNMSVTWYPSGRRRISSLPRVRKKSLVPCSGDIHIPLWLHVFWSLILAEIKNDYQPEGKGKMKLYTFGISD